MNMSRRGSHESVLPARRLAGDGESEFPAGSLTALLIRQGTREAHGSYHERLVLLESIWASGCDLGLGRGEAVLVVMDVEIRITGGAEVAAYIR